MPTGDQGVDAALRMIVALAEASIAGADGVSVSLHRNGHLTSVATTDPSIGDLDAEQYSAGEGPCVAASVAGHRFYVEALAEELRWPAFVQEAQARGFNSVLSCPLLSLNEPVGALNIYSRTPRAFSAEDEQLASVFTAQASIVVSEARIGVSNDQLSLRLTKALHARKVIAQAQGIIMERLSLNPDAAYNELLDFSRQSHIPLRQRAEEVVAAAQENMAAAAAESAGDP
jgi:GAF domain-containing protein